MKFTLYDNGEIIGESNVVMIDGVNVIESIAPVILQMKEHAKKDGIELTLASGLRTWDDQMVLRKKNVKEKSKANDTAYLTTAPASAFNPFTAKPGYSNHHDGKAYDFNVTGKPQSYSWLVKNAAKFGMVRTVPSERWHWEYRPKEKNFFAFVPKKDKSWDGLI